MKIVVAVDGSAHSHDAVKHLIGHVDWYREKPTVELVFVHPPLPRLPAMALTSDQVQRYYQEEGDAALGLSKSMLASADIQFNAHTIVGPVAESIVKQAAQTGCELILMATRGSGAGDDLLLGSTATKVLYFSRIPVLVVNSSAPV